MASKKAEWAAAGLCRWCGSEVQTRPDGSKAAYCSEHQKYFADYAARYRADHGIGKQRRCSVCRKTGCNMGKHDKKDA